MQRSPLEIRPARAADLDAMCGLLGDLFSLEADFSFCREKQLAGLKLLLDRPGCRLLAAQAGAQVVGMCSGQVVVSTAEGGRSIWVEDVVVSRKWRGQGVGARMLAALADWAREQGAQRLQLVADRDNQDALGFYQRLGWNRTRLICLRQRISVE